MVNLKTGDVPHWARITGAITELYDVTVLPGVKRPSIIGFQTDEIRRMISMGEAESL